MEGRMGEEDGRVDEEWEASGRWEGKERVLVEGCVCIVFSMVDFCWFQV